MHAAPRKLSRINDPVYEKDYGNSDKVYGNNDKVYSSNNKLHASGGKHSFRRSVSPDSRSTSPKDRSMYGKGNGMYGNSRLDPRMRRDSDRDCRDSRDYGKYSRKENREERERDRSPRDRKWNDYKEKSREKEGEGSRITTCGDWTEHYSSSRKKYYYNCKTEVSQWEKPKEWADLEKSRQAAKEPAKLNCDRNVRGSQDKHSSDHRASPLTTSSSGINNRPRENRTRREVSNHEGRGSESSATRDTEISSSNDATPTSEGEESNNRNEQSHNLHPPGVVSLSAALPRLTSQPTPGLSHTQPGPGPGGSYDVMKSIATALRLSSSAPLSTPMRVSSAHAQQNPLSSSRQPSIHTVTSSQMSPQSPPTPTQEDRLPSPAPSSLSSLSAVSPLTALRAAPVSLTPSLGRLYKEPLIGHVLGWPAEHLEKACNKVSEDHHSVTSHVITKVSAELKMARSLVRLAEIQATLQEQRILFLRQQSADLEGLGRPQHSRGDRDHMSRERDHNSRDRDRLYANFNRDPEDHLMRDHTSSSRDLRDHHTGGGSSRDLPGGSRDQASGSRGDRNHVMGSSSNSSHASHALLSRGISRENHESSGWGGGAALHK